MNIDYTKVYSELNLKEVTTKRQMKNGTRMFLDSALTTSRTRIDTVCRAEKSENDIKTEFNLTTEIYYGLYKSGAYRRIVKKIKSPVNKEGYITTLKQWAEQCSKSGVHGCGLYGCGFDPWPGVKRRIKNCVTTDIEMGKLNPSCERTKLKFSCAHQPIENENVRMALCLANIIIYRNRCYLENTFGPVNKYSAKKLNVII